MPFIIVEAHCPRCGSSALKAPDRPPIEYLNCPQCGRIPIEEFKSQVDRGKITRSDDYNLAEHPEHAKALGMLVAAWANVEHSLCLTMSFLMRTPVWNIQAAYYAIVNNSARVDAISALTHSMVGEDQFKDRLVKLLDRTQSLAEKRNGYVHKNWAIGLHNVNDLYLIENIGFLMESQARKIHVKEILDVSKDIMQLASDINNFNGEYSAGYPMYLSPESEPDALRKRFSKLHRRRFPGNDPNQS